MTTKAGWSRMPYTILHGDVLDMLATLPDASVHCCVTSPPYWGLRDYGTAKWDGGDADCDHIGAALISSKSTLAGFTSEDVKLRTNGMPFKGECGKCGATRIDKQLGLEATPAEFVAKMVAVFAEVRRVLRDDGTCWVNLGDSYATGTQRSTGRNDTQRITPGGRGGSFRGGSRQQTDQRDGCKPKDLIGIPWRVAFALQDQGWYLRSEIIWAKPNAMPGSQQDRPTSSHEAIFLMSKREQYWSDFDAIKTPPRESTLVRLAQDVQAQAGSHSANGGVRASGKQRGHSRKHYGFNDRWDSMSKAEQQSTPAMMRDVWFVPPENFAGSHFAVMPGEIARRCILAGCPEGGTVLDPFSGSGTTGMVALRHHRNYIGIELNPEYVAMSHKRITEDAPLFNSSFADDDFLDPNEDETMKDGYA